MGVGGECFIYTRNGLDCKKGEWVCLRFCEGSLICDHVSNCDGILV